MGLPVEGPCQNEVVVRGQLAQPRLELALVDETAGLVDYDEGEHGPGIGWSVAISHAPGGLDAHGDNEVGGVWSRSGQRGRAGVCERVRLYRSHFLREW